MDSFFILVAVVCGLIFFDLLAVRFGVDSRNSTAPAYPERLAGRPDCWW